MENQGQLFSLKKYTRHFKYGASFAWAFTGTMLIASSIVQASDMQIYAVPTAGKKTIVMMLDTSGSMGVNSSSNSIDADYDVCSDRSTVNTETGGSGSYTYTRTYCSVGYSSSSTSNYQRLKDVCYNPNKNADGSYSTRTGALKCYDRISRLKDGMFAFLDSDSSTLTNVRVGLGHYSVNGSGNAGKILVPASVLGAVNSTQRNTIKTAVKDLTASGGTPTAAAYAEAAAYLMGTSTVAPVDIAVDVYKQVSTRSIVSYSCPYSAYPHQRTDVSPQRCYERYDSWRSQPYRGDYINASPVYSAATSTTYYQCNSLNSTNFDEEAQKCRSSGWTSLGNTAPADLAQAGNYDSGSDIIYYKNEMQSGSNPYSGFSNSVASSKKTDLVSYNSPLPAAADRVSCDGQGVYILSDGQPTDKTDSTLNSVMNASLDSTSFNCSASGALSSTRDWHCMSNYAKKLFNGGLIQSVAANATNPVNVPIQTAFVGFGSDFSDLGSSDVINACKLTSRTQSDRTGHDACSPNQATNAVAAPGYGNGGFFTAQTAQGVTDSVIAFINNIGKIPLAPLTTGAISVPADALSPSGLQPYGYLRALEPDPQSGKLAWAGNLKRYKVLTTGANAGAFAGANGSTLVYNADGSFKAATKDLWNSSSIYNNKSYNDGGIIGLGGAYSRVPMPISGQTEDLTVTPQKYEYAANPNGLRKLFTDVAATGGAALTGASNGASLLRIPEGPVPATNVATYVLGKFSTQTTLKDISVLVKQKLLNYLGYSIPLDTTVTGVLTLPTTLSIPATPHLAMGGSIHSFPVQMTYSGTLDASGNLTSTRSQSILYGTMEGGLHIVDSNTGVEQMVFVPAELLRNTTASKALVKGETAPISPQAGLDGAWVADSLYVAQKSSSSSEDSVVKASRMNIYGGLRMGGESYYGLNVLDPTAPKFLFRVGRDQTDFSRMGQSWSKPVLANIRYNNEIRRVMIVGGGYDACYEDPTFTLAASGDNSSCTTKTKAQGNAVYIVDATTGARLWWTSDSVSGVGTANTDMKHSIVSRISAIDRNGDGLVDHLYFGDLGGQVFRADLNNTVGTTTANFGKRVVRLANLATTSTGAALTNGKNPRFYEAPTVTIHDQGATTFMLIGIAAGNRSTPLDVYPIIGRDGMSPTNALNDRLVNNVYGIIDRDFIKRNLFTEANNSDGTAFTLSTQNINLSTLQKDPQTLSGNIPSLFIGTSTTIKNGWYRSLSSNSAGTERADNSFRITGGMKAFEEPIALTGNLIVPVYDPQGTGIAPQNPCLPRVVGETNRQRYCLPFGVCLNSDGSKNNSDEDDTGFKTKTIGCPAGVTECNDNTLGAGIVGITPAPITESTNGSCPDFTIAGNEKGTGKWQCIPTINPTRWYERWK